MEKIPVAQLPKTFRDAMQISMCLGISYLWIDSLCILQDSAADWLRESALMHSQRGPARRGTALEGLDPMEESTSDPVAVL